MVVGCLFISAFHLLGQSTFTYSLAGPSTDVFHSACEAENGDLLISGISRSFAGNGTQDIYVVRLDSTGQVIWDHFYGGISDEFGARIVPRQNGGFLIAGSTFSYGEGIDDIYFIAIDDSGIVEWEKTFGDSASQNISDLIALSDGGFAVTGKWLENDSVLGQSFVLKVDEYGEMLFLKYYGGNYFDFGLAMIQMPTNQFMLGNLLSIYNDSLGRWENRMQLLGLDEVGEIIWADTIQHPALHLAASGGKASKILLLSDSTYLVLGDMAVHLDHNGNILSVSETPRANAAVSSSNMEFLSVVDGNLRYYTSGGDLIWEEEYDISVDEIIATKDGGYLVVGNTDLDMHAIKVNCRGTMNADTAICIIPDVPGEFSFQFWPNPVSDQLHLSIEGLPSDEQIKWELFDMKGRLALSQQDLSNGEYTFPLESISNGLYVLRYSISDQSSQHERLVIQH